MVLVQQMHRKFGFEASPPCMLTPEEKAFRIAAMREEITEYENSDDIVSHYDALIDLMVFTVGTLERHGFPLLEGFMAVMEANMKKELGQNGNKRGGFKRDLVKPADWVGPEKQLGNILYDRLEACADAAKQLRLHWVSTAREPSAVLADTRLSLKTAEEADQHMEPGKAAKFDANKTRVDLLPIGPLMLIAEVLTFGAKKYAANSWREGTTAEWGRTYGSVLRHLFSWWSGEDNDPQTGKSHLAHAATQLMILMEHVQHNKDKDDRFKR